MHMFVCAAISRSFFRVMEPCSQPTTLQLLHSSCLRLRCLFSFTNFHPIHFSPKFQSISVNGSFFTEVGMFLVRKIVLQGCEKCFCGLFLLVQELWIVFLQMTIKSDPLHSVSLQNKSVFCEAHHLVLLLFSFRSFFWCWQLRLNTLASTTFVLMR